MKLILKHPIVVSDKVTISELNFRDHTIAADYLAFDVRGGVAQRIALIANIAGSEDAVIKCMNGIDYRRAEAIVDKLIADDEAQSVDSDADVLKQAEKK